MAPAIARAPLAMKTVKHDELYCPEFWAQEALRMFEEPLPARNFAALPGPCTDKINVHKPRPLASHTRRQDEGAGIAVFKNGDMECIIELGNGDFTYTKRRNVIWDDSALFGTTCREGDELPTECNLTGVMDAVRGVSLRDVLHADGPFDLELVQGGNKYTFKDCWWTALDYDMTEAYFDVQFTCQGEQTVTWVE